MNLIASTNLILVFGQSAGRAKGRVYNLVATSLSVSLATAALMSALALRTGFDSAMQNSGSDDVAIVLRRGAQTELNSSIELSQARVVAELPTVLESRGLSGEMYVVIQAPRKEDGVVVNLPLRGIAESAVGLRPNVTLTEGRMYRTGTQEVVVGRSVAREYDGFGIGQKIDVGGEKWLIVGVMEADGTVFESEVWADVSLIRTLFNWGIVYQSVRILFENGDQIETLRREIERDPRLELSVQSEAAYYSQQAQPVIDIVTLIGFPLILVMTIGAVASCTNAMYDIVSARSGEIVTLKAIGFDALSASWPVMIEGGGSALLGGVVGCLGAYFALDGTDASTLNALSFAQVSFYLQSSVADIGIAMLLAFVIVLFASCIVVRKTSSLPLDNAMGGVR